MSGRAAYVAALAPARAAAFHAGEHVGQESFMSADEIVDLARRAEVSAGSEVLDLCCGVAGAGGHVVRTTGCRLLGLDRDATALALARTSTTGFDARFEVAALPPIPVDGPFDVVTMFETMLAFDNKPALLAEVARVLRPGGRFAFTFEEGAPLTADERAGMPDGNRIFLTPRDEMLAMLRAAGLEPQRCEAHTAAHADLARRLRDAFMLHQEAMAAALGEAEAAAIVTAHEQWVAWLGGGRVRKYAVVAIR